MADFEAFAKEIMERWPECGVDGFELQELAERHGLIESVPGGFDPAKHVDRYGDAEPGDPWMRLTYTP